jgi:CSLREA domain-containing protein
MKPQVKTALRLLCVSLGLLLIGLQGAAQGGTLTVTKIADTNDGACNADCSLREALAAAVSGDVIEFAKPLFDTAQTIDLALGELTIGTSLSIKGTGAQLLTVRRDTGGDYRIFNISTGGLNVAIAGLTIRDGRAVGDGNARFGGGIFSLSSLTLTECVITHNYAEVGGGGVALIGGDGNFTGCTFSDNTSGFQGGGITFQNGGGHTLTLVNCTLSGNRADGAGLGGAILHSNNRAVPSTLNVINCTLAGNTSATMNGGSIRTESVSSGAITTRLLNTILASATPPNLSVLGTVTMVSLGNNLADDDGNDFLTQGTDKLNTNALLAPLADYGGPTPTRALLPGSPAINMGNNCVLTNNCASDNLGFNLTTDQRGLNRQVSSAVDIGAFESRGFTLAVAGGSSQSTPVTQAFANPLAVAVSSAFNEPVAGGRVTFTAPTNGASATFSGNPATINANGQASVGATANTQPGFYQVSAAANGAAAVTFNLFNFCVPVIFTAALTPPTCNGATNGQLTINAAGGVGTLLYSINNGQSFQPAHVFTGLAAGTYQVMVKDASSCPPATASISLTEPAAISFTPTPVNPTCHGASNGSLTISATGGAGALQYSINGGQSFQSTPVFSNLVAGSYGILVKDANGCLSALTTVTLTQPAALSLSPATLPTGVAGQPFAQSFTASGGTGAKSISLQGALPNWLNFNPATATLSGTAPQPATVSFSLTVTDQANCTATFNYTLQFVCPTLTLTPAMLPNGVQGANYHQMLTAAPSGTTYSYAMTTGALPQGLTLASNGTLSGTPTAAGNYAFSVQVAGWGTCTKQQSYNLLITGTCSTITVNPTALSAGSLGAAYQQTFSALGGTAPYTFNLATGALPSGLTLNANTGELSGTPMVSGTFAFTLRATGQGGCTGSRSYVLVINCGTLTINPPSLPNGTRSTTYSQQLSLGTGGNATFSLLLGSLPPGFSLSSAGLLSGMTSQTGTYNFTVKAVLGSCQGTKAYTLVISNGSQAALALSSDYDGDGKADPALWSAPDGTWRILRSSDSQTVNQHWGTAGDVPLLGDYDGDGKSDLAVFRPADATFYVKRSSDGAALIKQWGLRTDVPVPSDYDGDGKTDIAVWRGSTGVWYILYSGRNSEGQSAVQTWGAGYEPYQDVPVVGDYDGDGRSDVAVFRRGAGTWLIKRSRDGHYLTKQWGLGTDVPVAHDYDGDGQTDMAAWRNGTWYIWQSATNDYRVTAWGTLGDQAGAGDYDGDGQADVAVWREAEQTWYIFNSWEQRPQQRLFGQSGDLPVGAKLR